MVNFDYITKEHKMPWSKLVTNSSRSGITNLWLNQINHEPDNEKIHLYTKDPYEAKYHLLINKRESMGINKSFTWFLLTWIFRFHMPAVP